MGRDIIVDCNPEAVISCIVLHFGNNDLFSVKVYIGAFWIEVSAQRESRDVYIF